MRHWVLLLLLAATVAVIAYLVVWVFTGKDDGLDPQEPDGRAAPLPGSRPLIESDISAVRFDTVVRGYRMAQVDAALRRAAYDIGYKQELIDVLVAEVIALREGRTDDAEALRQARNGALEGSGASVAMTFLETSSADGSSADGASGVESAGHDAGDEATNAPHTDADAHADIAAERDADPVDGPAGDATRRSDDGDRAHGQATAPIIASIRTVTR